MNGRTFQMNNRTHTNTKNAFFSHLTLRTSIGWLVLAAAGVAVAGLNGCSPALPPPPRMAAVPTVVVPHDKPVSEGSLWRTSSTYTNLYADHRAAMVGDIVTIQVVENAQASKTASTKTSRGSSLSGSVQSFFGAPLGAIPFKPEASGSLTNEFDGSGSTSRQDTLVTTLTATITEELPRLRFRIEGYREVTINNERQYILLRGVIRQQDITLSNTVLSTDIADAQIMYSGNGVLSDKQRPGWLARAIDFGWPF